MKFRKWSVLFVQLIAYTVLLLHAFVPHHHHEQVVYLEQHECPHHAENASTPPSFDLKCQTLEHAWQHSSSTPLEDVYYEPILVDGAFYSFIPFERFCLRISELQKFYPPDLKTFQSFISKSSILRGPPTLFSTVS